MDQDRGPATLLLNVGDGAAERTGILRAARFDVAEAPTPEQALRFLDHRQPALVLIDARVAGGAADLCRRVKRRPNAPVVVIAAPASQAQEHRDAGWDAGVDAYVGDAAAPAELLAQVRAALRIHDATQRARHTEARYRSLLESAPDAVMINRRGLVAYVNTAAVTLFGAASAADLLERDALSLFVPEGHALILERLAVMRAGAAVPLVENRVLRLDGTTRDIEVAAAPCYFDNDRAFQVVMRDITERKRRESDEAFLNTLLPILIHERDAEELTRKLLQALGEHLHADAVTFGDRTPEGTFESRRFDSREPARIRTGTETEFDLLAPATQTCFAAGETIIVTDAATDPRTAPRIAAFRGLGVAAFAQVPLVSDGVLVGMLGVASRTPRQWQPRDIHLLEAIAARLFPAVERARAEAALRVHQQRLSAFMNAVTESMFLFDTNGIVLAVNATGAERMGKRVEDVVGRDRKTLVPESVAAAREQQFQEVLRTGRPVQFTDERDGIKFSHNFYPVTDAHGVVLGCASFSADVTEQQRAQDSLLELTQRLSYHIDHGPVAVVEWGPDMRLIRWSAEAERLFGWTAAEVLGKRLEDFRWVYTDDNEQVQQVAQVLQSGADVHRMSTNRNYRKDGSVVVCEWYNSSLVDASGKLRSILSQVVDITERARLEEQLRQHTKELEKANRLKDEFLATLSHEMRTPLNAILGWLAMLKGGRLDPRAQQRAIDTIERNAQAQAQLISDILDVSGMQAGKIVLDTRPTAVTAILEHVIETMQPIASAKPVTLEARVDTGAAVVHADTARLEQVVWNLLSNAIKFSQPGGRVELRAEAAGDQILITVRDEGVGIDPAFLPFVFERFRQADASSTRAHGGLGLGMAISKHFVELHGGTIEAASEGRGRGATFTVRLPRADVSAAPAAGDRPGTSIAGMHVLVVDDHEDSREMLDTMLASAGARVTTAPSSEAAVEAFREDPCDVALIDLAMPGEDGFVCLARLRAAALQAGRSFTAVAVTAAAREQDRAEALRQGFAGHIAKPIRPETIIAAVAATRAPG